MSDTEALETRVAALEADLKTATWLLAEVSHGHKRLSALIAQTVVQQLQQQLQDPKVQEQLTKQLFV
jgi:hypothetical protein